MPGPIDRPTLPDRRGHPDPVRSDTVDLLDLAPQATWISGLLSDDDGHSVHQQETLAFGGPESDPRGHARTDVVLLDGGAHAMALRTHPRWGAHGTVKGFLPAVTLPPGATFAAEVGFMAGAVVSDGVRFQVWIHFPGLTGETGTRVIDLVKRPDGGLTTVRADLSWLAGQTVAIELRVDTGPRSDQDWAVWVAPRIERRNGSAARLWRFRVRSLTLQRVENVADYNDPALAMLYFRSDLGRRGSSKVVIVDAKRLGQDLPVGRTVEIGENRGLFVDDAMVAWDVMADGAALAAQSDGRDFIPIAGLALAALDIDQVGDGRTHATLVDKARKLLVALREHVETLTLADVSSSPERVDAAFKAVLAAVKDGDGGGFDWSFGLGHDLVGIDQIAFLGADRFIVDRLLATRPSNEFISPIRTDTTFRYHFRKTTRNPNVTGIGPPITVGQIEWRAEVLIIPLATTPAIPPGL